MRAAVNQSPCARLRQRISIIVAMARNRVIGANNRLPWHLPADLRRFRALTMGHHIVMGRKTCESIGRALPGRVSVVVTRRAELSTPGCLAAESLESALDLCADDAEVFVIGGGELYRKALPLVDRIYLTQVQAEFDGDVFFPPLDEDDWSVTAKQEIPADPSNAYSCCFFIYDRAKATKTR